MNFQNSNLQRIVKQLLFSRVTGLVVAGGIAAMVTLAPTWVSAQEATVSQSAVQAQSSSFNSPLDGAARQRGSSERSQYLADALGLTVEQLAAAQEAARNAAEGRENFQSQLAAQLGISEDALDEAKDAAHDAAIAQAIADGRITAEEAAEREAQQELREVEEALKETIERNQLFADALNLPREEFEAAIADGTSVRELAAQQGLENGDLREELDQAYANAVQNAVGDGLVSQEQADAILADDGDGRRGDRNGGGRNNNRGDRNNDGNRGNRGNRDDNANQSPDDNGSAELPEPTPILIVEESTIVDSITVDVTAVEAASVVGNSADSDVEVGVVAGPDAASHNAADENGSADENVGENNEGPQRGENNRRRNGERGERGRPNRGG